MPVLAALCDILEVTPVDLITTSAENATLRKAATASDPGRADVSAILPQRARVRPEA